MVVLVSLRASELTVLIFEEFVAACEPGAARIIATQNYDIAMPFQMGKLPACTSISSTFSGYRPRSFL